MRDDESIECTAFESSGNDERNRLFTPPCACPRCAALPDLGPPQPNTIWLPKDGTRVRHHVTNMTLGEAGRALLG